MNNCEHTFAHPVVTQGPELTEALPCCSCTIRNRYHIRERKNREAHVGFFFFLEFNLFIFRERGKEGEREGEKHPFVIGFLLHTPNWGPGLQTRRVP